MATANRELQESRKEISEALTNYLAQKDRPQGKISPSVITAMAQPIRLAAPKIEMPKLPASDTRRAVDRMIAQVQRSREQAAARKKAMTGAEASRKQKAEGEKSREELVRRQRETDVRVTPAGRKEKTNASPALQKYIASRGVVQGRLGTNAAVSTRINQSARDNVAQAIQASAMPAGPQVVSADYAGGGWYEHRTTKRIIWMPGLRSQSGLDRLGTPGTYLGNSATINGELYETSYLPDGKSFRRRTETVKPENYTIIKKWEDKANQGGVLVIFF